MHARLGSRALGREAAMTPRPSRRPIAATALFLRGMAAIPWFDYFRQSYLINSRFLSDSIETLEAERAAKERLRFIARQFSDAMSPANFAATNPEALKLALDTKGESPHPGNSPAHRGCAKGLISTTDESVFELGKNLAVTEGAVSSRMS